MSVPGGRRLPRGEGGAGQGRVGACALGSGRCGGEPGVAGDDQVGPGGGVLDVQQGPSSSPGEGRGHGEHAEPQPLGFPPSSIGVVQRDQLGPGGQVQGELDDHQPDPVLVDPLQCYLEWVSGCSRRA